MSFQELKGKLALVTGASSGLGADFARELAAAGSHLVLVARREEMLLSLKEELTRQFGVEVETIAMDLVVKDAPQVLYERLKAEGKSVDVLINNAGLGLYGEFTSIPWEKERNMLELDIVTLVHLTKLFLPDMIARDSGYILQLASIGGYQPSPLYASYSAAKSYVLNFGEALNFELRKTRVKCTVLSPGITATEFLKVSGQEATFYQRRMIMQSRDVVRIGLKNMLKGKPSVVPGRLNALTVWSNRLMPRRMSALVGYQLMK